MAVHVNKSNNFMSGQNDPAEKKFEPILDRVGLGGQPPENSGLNTFGWLLLVASVFGSAYFLFGYSTTVYAQGEGEVVNMDLVASKISFLVFFTGLLITSVLLLLVTRLEKVIFEKKSTPSDPPAEEKLP
jgi:hypothetical protein